MKRGLFFLLFLALPLDGAARDIVGWVERVRLYPGNIEVRARIDTGAKTSSLGIDGLEYFERDGQQWVRFSTTSRHGVTLPVERPLHGISRIKRDHGEIRERPVVMLGICLAGFYSLSEVNLEYRGHLNYRMLIGRSFLDGHFLVDPDDVFVNPPRCESIAPKTRQ